MRLFLLLRRTDEGVDGDCGGGKLLLDEWDVLGGLAVAIDGGGGGGGFSRPFWPGNLCWWFW